MRKIAFSLLTAMVAFTVCSAEISPEQLARNRERKRERIQQLTGGWIVLREKDAGRFTFVNAQSRVSTEALSPALADMERFLSIDVAIVPGEWDGESGDMGFCYVIDDARKPALVIVPEEGWGVVNVAKLGDKNLESRARKELWRALAFICGAADTSMERCLLKPIFKPEDLDLQQVDTISPEPLLKMDTHIRRMGIKQYKRITYKQAAIEGIAPEPTNEYQRVIWEKVKAEQSEKPSNPLKITPGMKPKGK